MIYVLPCSENDGSPTNSTPKHDNKRGAADSDSDGSSSKKSKLDSKKDIKQSSTPAPPASRGGQTSFPAASTTDAVRIKCRELLFTAMKADGGFYKNKIIITIIE